MTPTITALILAAAYLVSIRLAYRLGKTTGFGEGIQCMEESQCGRIVGTQNKRNE